MAELGLPEAIGRSVRNCGRRWPGGADADIQFPVGTVTLEFQGGVKKTGEGSGKVKVWVLEAGAAGKIEHDQVQRMMSSCSRPSTPTVIR
jgi:hypothetical protein